MTRGNRVCGPPAAHVLGHGQQRIFGTLKSMRSLSKRGAVKGREAYYLIDTICLVRVNRG